MVPTTLPINAFTLSPASGSSAIGIVITSTELHYVFVAADNPGNADNAASARQVSFTECRRARLSRARIKISLTLINNLTTTLIKITLEYIWGEAFHPE